MMANTSFLERPFSGREVTALGGEGKKKLRLEKYI
jgi:hypothetical protein